MAQSATPPDIPDQNWANPFSPGSFLHRLFDEVVREQRDLIIILDDLYGRRGTGKTVASMKLADGMDQTDEGLTWAKCSLNPEEIRNAYAQQPVRSGLVLDEGEVGASNRDAMTTSNKALREIMSMGRVEQKYVVVNTPIRGFIDKDLQKLADVWISMVRKGQALVHHYRWESYSKQLLTPKKQTIEFSDIPRGTDLRDVYNRLTREKRKKIGGEDGDAFVTEGEVQERLQKARDEARRDRRDELILSIWNHPEIQQMPISQRMIAEAVGLTQPAISDILNDETE